MLDTAGTAQGKVSLQTAPVSAAWAWDAFGAVQSRAKLAEEPVWLYHQPSLVLPQEQGEPHHSAARQHRCSASGTAYHREQPMLMGS